MMRLLLLVLTMTQFAGVMQSPLRTVQRLPLQKKERLCLRLPLATPARFLGIDPKTGKELYYDPKPEVVPLNAKSGSYGLRWVGYDGKQKMIVYHRPDVFEAIIGASVKRDSSGQYLYTYTVHNLPGSAQTVNGFAVQNFSVDVRPLPLMNVHAGMMSHNREMKEGNWLRFAVLGVRSGIAPGRSFEHQLLSPAPPGLVECRAHSILGMKGVGEEPPQELENVLPGYEAWPSGYTIGPVDKLKNLSVEKRAKYIRRRLSHFQKLGWITADSVSWYDQNLRGDNLETLNERSHKDLIAGKITSEISAMITGISL